MGKNKKTHRSQGFTLIELSIVLVIVGLLVGGVLTGQSLIHAAEVRAIGQEFDQWHQAVNNFRQRYNGFPGDIRDATDFWGAVNTDGSEGNCSDPIYDYSDGIETCNGDGDRSVYSRSEQHRFWQHLANAGLIPGTYTGIPGPAGTAHVVIGENGPESEYPSGGWGIRDKKIHAGNNYFFAAHYGHVFFFGSQHHVGEPIQKLLTPYETWNIDDKFDDGMPNRGQVLAHWWGPCTTAVDENDRDAEYDISVDDISCSLVFKNAM